MKKKLLILAAISLSVLLVANQGLATELRFSETQMPLGTTFSVVFLTGTEYSAYGIDVNNVYRYNDVNDPFSDGAENQNGTYPYGLGISTGSLGTIDFLTPVANLEVDWWDINNVGVNVNVYNTAGTLIHASSGFGSGTEYLTGLGNIDYLTFGDTRGASQISNIRFDPVPEPTTMLLLGTGLVGMAGAARRKKKNQV